MHAYIHIIYHYIYTYTYIYIYIYIHMYGFPSRLGHPRTLSRFFSYEFSTPAK